MGADFGLDMWLEERSESVDEIAGHFISQAVATLFRPLAINLHFEGLASKRFVVPGSLLPEYVSGPRDDLSLLPGEVVLPGGEYTTIPEKSSQWYEDTLREARIWIQNHQEDFSVESRLHVRMWGLARLVIDESDEPRWVLRECNPFSHNWRLVASWWLSFSGEKRDASLAFYTEAYAWSLTNRRIDEGSSSHICPVNGAYARRNALALARFLRRTTTESHGEWSWDSWGEGWVCRDSAIPDAMLAQFGPPHRGPASK